MNSIKNIWLRFVSDWLSLPRWITYPITTAVLSSIDAITQYLSTGNWNILMSAVSGAFYSASIALIRNVLNKAKGGLETETTIKDEGDDTK